MVLGPWGLAISIVVSGSFGIVLGLAISPWVVIWMK